jgi:hypothetical protein
VETNTWKLVDRVACAEKALRLRAEELGMSSEGVEESRAISDAERGLSVLKKEIESQVSEITTERLESSQTPTSANQFEIQNRHRGGTLQARNPTKPELAKRLIYWCRTTVRSDALI